ncbi:hypothetical protein DL766_010616 [Monosporascus sp. MC13-8B]|uniref:Cellobiose dehydrogenase-like cytochrome domain-containing protein n=1 Tax=Monosporascus cannonballus TaxID=155416 RepID=A0ABY0H3B0_9PEZI|nr:hypothetical protein DL762_006157 [Monosporascus cannonballus]RYO90964.1 hypothetical protein DL763_005135 [Monosporascus cannonballus]RYP01975.1 hypothetical protein DL766_010616 [Monosporascus sp. MC13-8B]
MKLSAVVAGVAGLTGSALAQDSVPVTDTETGITFQAFTNPEGVSYGIALPANASAAGGYDIILQVTAPVEVGWAGIAWGGAMVYNPLSVVWPNGEGVVASPRMAYGYYQPEIYEEGTLTLLKGSGANATHFKVTALARGFSTWTDFDGNVAHLDGSAQVRLAYALSRTPVDDPASAESDFTIHDSVGRWVHDLAAARSAEFPKWVADNSLPSRAGGREAVAREERHPVVPRLRDSARLRPGRWANAAARA